MSEKGQPVAKFVGRKKETDDHQFAYILFNNSQNFGFFLKMQEVMKSNSYILTTLLNKDFKKNFLL